MTHPIEVTQEDIKNGKHARWECCALALAIRRKVPSARVGVTVILRHEDDINGVEMPPHVLKFRRDFDGGFPVNPITFEIDL